MHYTQRKALLVDGTRGKRAIYRCNEAKRSGWATRCDHVRPFCGSRSETEGLSCFASTRTIDPKRQNKSETARG